MNPCKALIIGELEITTHQKIHERTRLNPCLIKSRTAASENLSKNVGISGVFELTILNTLLNTLTD
jgi:hypothetical protein